MATAHLSAFLRRLTRGMVAQTLLDQSDRQLVEQFLDQRDEAVFETLVRRHGPMVYGVCWRVLMQPQDAEDAFQATFLLLAQKLRTLCKHDSLASWLHGIAHRVALKAKAQAALRRRHEQKAGVLPAPSPDEITWKELRTLLDAELAHLPEKWRQPLILCYLEGQTQDEAAAQLGWSRTTLQRRLVEARAVLGRHLTQRGVVWPAALSAVLLSDCVTSAALPPGLVDSTVEVAARVAAGQAATAVASSDVIALTEGGVTSLRKSNVVMAVLLAVGLVGAGAGAYCLPYLHATQKHASKEGSLLQPNQGVGRPLLERAQVMDNTETLDALFRQAVSALDAGDVTTLSCLLAAHPRLVRERLDSPGDWLRAKVSGSLEGYFRKPYLLWFVAENPVRNDKLPKNIAQVTSAIIQAAQRERVDSLQEQLD